MDVVWQAATASRHVHAAQAVKLAIIDAAFEVSVMPARRGDDVVEEMSVSA